MFSTFLTNFKFFLQKFKIFLISAGNYLRIFELGIICISGAACIMFLQTFVVCSSTAPNSNCHSSKQRFLNMTFCFNFRLLILFLVEKQISLATNLHFLTASGTETLCSLLPSERSIFELHKIKSLSQSRIVTQSLKFR